MCSLRAQCMISNNNSINSGSLRRCVCRYFLQNNVYNKKIIRFGFCDILNNQGLGKCYQPRPSARLITLTSTLIIPDITKTSSNNCLLSPQQSCPEPCWNFVLNNRFYIIAIFTLPIHFGHSQHPSPQPPKKKTKSCISIVFVLPWDVRL